MSHIFTEYYTYIRNKLYKQDKL